MSKDSETKDYLLDLRKVGPQKPLGYLPINTIKMCGSTVDEQIQESIDRCLDHQLFSDSECHVFTGALYIYDEIALMELLTQRSQVLLNYGWPEKAERFVQAVATRQAPPKTELYDLIADAFADYKNPGRKKRFK